MIYVQLQKPSQNDFMILHRINISECKPIESIAFAKTHKTGSTTLQNIFLRYAYNHDLTLALPIQGTVNRASWKLTTSVITQLDF